MDIVIGNFDHLTQARAAMSELRRIAEGDAITLGSAAIVVREPDGRFWIPEDEARVGFTGAAAEEAGQAARREADRVLRERRKAAGEQSIRDRMSELKEKVAPGR